MARFPAALLFLILTAILASRTNAQDFRVETDVFVGDGDVAAVQYVTLFSGDIVYDFRLTSPDEVMILDLARSRIVLMDRTKGIKTEIPTTETIEWCAALKAHIDESNALFHFACNPRFEVECDEAAKSMQLSSPLLTYKVRGEKPKNSAAVSRYQEFADWSARVSALRAGGLPPNARIEVNRHVAQKGWIPEHVERTVSAGRFNSQKLEMRTRHISNWILSETDRKRITRAGDELVSLRSVPFTEYSGTNVASNKESKR